MRHLWLLGPVRVEQGQKTQESNAGMVPRFRSRRTVGLLGYLVSEGRPAARDHLAAFFWPDEAPSKGRANLSRELHNLSQILPDCWEMDRQSVTFCPAAGTPIDIYQLQQLEEQERWGEAADLLGGEFLEGLYLENNPEFESWLMGERARWRARAEDIFRRVIEGYTRRGRYSDALHHARQLLQLAPWDEETHRQVMRLLAWSGRRGAAMQQFESCKQMLREQLDVDPHPETVALHRQIQTGKLDFPPQLPAFLSEEQARHAFARPLYVGREGELAQLDTFMAGALAGEGRIIFITGGPGRGKTASLNAYAQRAMANYSNLLVAGGKCNAYSGLGDPYLPFREIMTMLTGDVEGRWDAGAISREHAIRLWGAFPTAVQVLLDHGPHLLDILVPGAALLSRAVTTGYDNAPWISQLREQVKHNRRNSREVEQGYLFRQITDVLCTVAQERPLLLILDDIQWADAASISLLFHLGRCLADADSRLLIACAYRPEEVTVGRNGRRHPLAKVLSEFKRTFGNGWVDLGHTAKDKNRRFLDALLDMESNRLGERFRAALFERTGGHPLFTIELLRAMQERGDLIRDTDGAWTAGPSLNWDLLPARVEAVIEERIDRLDSELRDILTIASVEGELFTAQVVAEIRNMPERSILNQLSQDLERRHRLVSEIEEVETSRKRLSRYRFGHILFQEYLYKRLSQGERRLLHGDIAVALEKSYEGQLDEIAVQLAHHYHQAGDNENAFKYFSLAASRATRFYESKEAIKHYTRAIQLAETVSADTVSLAKLHRERGLAFERVGIFDKAHADHTAILRIAQAAGEQQAVWQAALDLGRLWTSRDYKQAGDYFETALKMARQLDKPALLATNLNWMGNWCANYDENPKKAVAYHKEALNIVENLGDRQELAHTLDLLGIAHLLEGDIPASVRYYDRSIALLRELGDRPRLVSSLIARAVNVSLPSILSSVPASPQPDSAQDYEEAISIAREIGSAPDEAWACWALGQLHIVKGRFGCALTITERGLRIASEIEHREWVVGTRFTLGILYGELLAPEEALKQLILARDLTKELHSRVYLQLVCGALAGIYLMLEEHKQTKAFLDTILTEQTPMNTARYCWIRSAELALAQGDPAQALEITERLIASAPGMSPGQVITYLWKLKAEALAAQGCTDEAIVVLHEAIDNAEDIGERFLLWRLHAGLARLNRAAGRPEEARKEYLTASALIDELAATVPEAALQKNFLERAYSTLQAPC